MKLGGWVGVLIKRWKREGSTGDRKRDAVVYYVFVCLKKKTIYVHGFCSSLY